MDDSLLGKPLALNLDGQQVTGRITAVHVNRLEVTLNVREPARSFEGMNGKAVLPDGQEVLFDLGRASHYTRLVVDVPFERGAVQEETKPVDERRRYFRLGVNCPVEVIEDSGQGRAFRRGEGQTVNLSGGGMLLQLGRNLVPGTYRFVLHMPDETLEVSGRVLRGNAKAGVPVEFININEGTRGKLIRFIFARLRALKSGTSAGAGEGGSGKRDETPRHWARREKFYKPARIRYW